MTIGELIHSMNLSLPVQLKGNSYTAILHGKLVVNKNLLIIAALIKMTSSDPAEQSECVFR